MCAINWIVEDVAIEPLCIVESDIKSKLFLSALFSDPDMTNFRDRLSIELVSGSYLSLIGLKNGVCVVIVLWLGDIIICADSHIKIILMRRPLNNQDWSLSDHIYKHILSRVYKQQLPALDIDRIDGHNQPIEMQLLIDRISIGPERIDNRYHVKTHQVKQFICCDLAVLVDVEFWVGGWTKVGLSWAA